MITISPAGNGSCTVQTDSVTFSVFPESPKKDAWCLLSHPEETFTNNKVISWPGEYDFTGITVRAIGQEQGRQVSYGCITENVRMAFVDAPVLDWLDADVERLGDIDVLVVAADNPKKVLALVEAVDPRIVILVKAKEGDLLGVAKACGLAQIQPVSEFKVKHGSLPQDARQVVVLG
jgi:hypothetical protein